MPDGGLFIFHGEGELRPELSMRVHPDGTITHYSLLAGKLSIHQARDFNPLGLPLTEPVREPSAGATTFAQFASLEKVYGNLARFTPRHAMPMVAEGRYRARASVIPWAGSSWAFRYAQLFTGEDAPLAKYENFALAHTGSVTGALQWEIANHSDDGHWWGGHCNGWAVSSIIRPEPTKAVFDPVSGVRFSIADQKGLLAVTDYCAHITMFGSRYRGEGSDITDVDPLTFHKAITYYVGYLKKPMAMDYRPDLVVDTHVVSGYNMRVRRPEPQRYRINIDVIMHAYDKMGTDRVGAAPAYTRSFVYDLFVDAGGTFVSGVWHSPNPDFIYVPVGSMTCDDRHLGITQERVGAILSLPSM